MTAKTRGRKLSIRGKLSFSQSEISNPPSQQGCGGTGRKSEFLFCQQEGCGFIGGCYAVGGGVAFLIDFDEPVNFTAV